MFSANCGGGDQSEFPGPSPGTTGVPASSPSRLPDSHLLRESRSWPPGLSHTPACWPAAQPPAAWGRLPWKCLLPWDTSFWPLLGPRPGLRAFAPVAAGAVPAGRPRAVRAGARGWTLQLRVRQPWGRRRARLGGQGWLPPSSWMEVINYEFWEPRGAHDKPCLSLSGLRGKGQGRRQTVDSEVTAAPWVGAPVRPGSTSPLVGRRGLKGPDCPSASKPARTFPWAWAFLLSNVFTAE